MYDYFHFYFFSTIFYTALLIFFSGTFIYLMQHEANLTAQEYRI